MSRHNDKKVDGQIAESMYASGSYLHDIAWWFDANREAVRRAILRLAGRRYRSYARKIDPEIAESMQASGATDYQISMYFECSSSESTRRAVLKFNRKMIASRPPPPFDPDEDRRSEMIELTEISVNYMAMFGRIASPTCR